MVSQLGEHGDKALSGLKSALKESGATLTIRGGGREVTIGGDDASFEDVVAERIESMGIPVQRDVVLGGGPQAGGSSDYGFLGEEFLTWLWFQFETKGGDFTLPGGRAVGVAIDDLLVFAAGGEDETTQTMRRGLPTRAPESREALRQGHRLAKVRLLIAEGPRQWTVTVDGATMLLGSVKLPEDAEECECAEDRTADRAANWLALRAIVDGLFAKFMRLRAGPDWLQREAVAMGEWMAS